MQRNWRVVCLAWLVCTVTNAGAADWRQFRGPGGQGVSSKRSCRRNGLRRKTFWKPPSAGAGTSSPVTVGDRIFLTCYTGYALDPEPGKMEDLRATLWAVIALGDGKFSGRRNSTPICRSTNIREKAPINGYSSSTPRIATGNDCLRSLASRACSVSTWTARNSGTSASATRSTDGFGYFARAFKNL